MFRAVEVYCKSSIKGITFLTINKEDMVAVSENLKLWYELGDTVPASRRCHHSVQTSQCTIKGKQLSINTTVFITHSFFDMQAPQNETQHHKMRLLSNFNAMTTLLADLTEWPAKTDFIFPYIFKEFPGIFSIFLDIFLNGQKGILGGNN